MKLFGPDGFKLSDEVEQSDRDQTGRRRWHSDALHRSGTSSAGRKRLDDALGRCIEFVKSAFPRGLRLEGLKIVIDCANGAAYKVAPARCFTNWAPRWCRSGSVRTVSTSISNCGATVPRQRCRRALLEPRCGSRHCPGRRRGPGNSCGRERAMLVDGDQVHGTDRRCLVRTSGRLAKPGGMVATVMSNLGPGALSGESLDLQPSAHAGRRPLCSRAYAPVTASMWAANSPDTCIHHRFRYHRGRFDRRACRSWPLLVNSGRLPASEAWCRSSQPLASAPSQCAGAPATAKLDHGADRALRRSSRRRGRNWASCRPPGHSASPALSRWSGSWRKARDIKRR